jgi:hypothetical protein
MDVRLPIRLFPFGVAHMASPLPARSRNAKLDSFRSEELTSRRQNVGKTQADGVSKCPLAIPGREQGHTDAYCGTQYIGDGHLTVIPADSCMATWRVCSQEHGTPLVLLFQSKREQHLFKSRVGVGASMDKANQDFSVRVWNFWTVLSCLGATLVDAFMCERKS